MSRVEPDELARPTNSSSHDSASLSLLLSWPAPLHHSVSTPPALCTMPGKLALSDPSDDSAFLIRPCELACSHFGLDLEAAVAVLRNQLILKPLPGVVADSRSQALSVLNSAALASLSSKADWLPCATDAAFDTRRSAVLDRLLHPRWFYKPEPTRPAPDATAETTPPPRRHRHAIATPPPRRAAAAARTAFATQLEEEPDEDDDHARKRPALLGGEASPHRCHSSPGRHRRREAQAERRRPFDAPRL